MIKRFKEFQLNEELSPETINSTIDKMKEKGQYRRGIKWELYYTTKDLVQFKNKEILGGLVIYGFDVTGEKEDKELVLSYGSPRQQEYNRTQGRLIYYIYDDKWSINLVDRKTARILCQIAKIINPNTQYAVGTGDFKIEGM